MHYETRVENKKLNFKFSTGWNTISYGFSMLGDFVEIIPNSNALDAAKQLIEHMETNGYFNDCYG